MSTAEASPLSLGPVSECLEKELRNQARRHGIVMWLDADARYQPFVDRLAQAHTDGALPYAVLGFRGSFLELMLSLAPLSRETDKEQIVVHLPGFREEGMKETPLFELYRAGARFRKGLDTLISEAAARRVAPERIEALVREGDLTLDKADAWLAAALEHSEGGPEALFSAMSPPALLDDLMHRRGVAIELAGKGSALRSHLEAQLGLPAEWQQTPSESSRTLAFAAASWALGVEYVDDLSHPPASESLEPATRLPSAVVAACRELASHLRRTHGDQYEKIARQTEAELQIEVQAARAADLGKIDTFPFEDEVVLEESLDALRQGAFAVAHDWAEQRIEGQSFWLERSPGRKSEWQLVKAAAKLGLAIEAAGPGLEAKTLDAAAERYAARGAAVDHAHRHMEQLRQALLYSQLDRFEALRPLLDAMRGRWLAWADAWARDFSQLCQREGFLPSAALQQRGVFDEVVRPLADDATTAYFMVDALRFEMGLELMQEMSATPATDAKLTHRMAELPSNTEVGMNVLAPVAEGGRLRPTVKNGKITSFRCGESRVSSPDTRRRAMQDRAGADSCPWLTLDDVLNRGNASLKATVKKAKLVIVHSEELDAAGEHDLGPKVFDQLLRQLRAAWRLLRDAGVKHFVITADHGYLLLHDRQENAQPHGRKIDPKRRHVLSTVAADHPGEVRVPLAQLGYDGVEDLHLMCPETTAAFDSGKGGSGFVHGGNSLQERMIPVLTITHRVVAGGSSLSYRALAKAKDGIAGMHCLGVEVEVAAQGVLAFARDEEIELALRAVDPKDVRVDLVQARDGGRVQGDSVFVPVDRKVEVFFRLQGQTSARAQIEVFHPGGSATVESSVVARRFEVASDGRIETAPPAAQPSSWLEGLPEGGIRQLFAHLAQFGTVSEAEAAGMLGGARQLRRFSAKFESYALLAPFTARIETVAGVKTYVKERPKR